MWRAALLTVVALLPAAWAGYIINDPEEVHLQRKLWKLEKEFFESEPHEHRHLRHRSKQFLGLMGRRDVVEPVGDPDAKAAPKGHAPKNGKLPSTHPAMKHLKKQQHAAADARVNLEGNIHNTIAHLNSVAVIKSKMVKTRFQILSEERKLQKLEEDHKRLDFTHRSLTQSLKRIMEPKLEYAEERLLRKEHEVKKLQTEDTAWTERVQKFHATSLAMIKERGESKANVEAALVAEERAHQERIAAEKHLRAAKKGTDLNVENYRYSETEERAVRNKEKHNEIEMRQAQAAVNRLSTILSTEKSRVDESMAAGKDRLQGQIRKLEEAKKKSSTKLSELKKEYAGWQARQQALTTHLEATKKGTSAASQDYADAQEAAFAAQRQRAVREAEKITDWAWNEWPGQDDKIDDPSLDDKDDKIDVP